MLIILGNCPTGDALICAGLYLRDLALIVKQLTGLELRHLLIDNLLL